MSDPETDSAVILISPGELTLPEQAIPLLPAEIPLAIGTEVGWLGYPGIAPGTLCFFSGKVSARRDSKHEYLIDGVAINGVSGGPVIYSTDTEGVQIVGIISAYVSNRATGQSLPGLSIAQDVSHFHGMISLIKNFDEAKQRQQSQQAESETSSPVPEPHPSAWERPS